MLRASCPGGPPRLLPVILLALSVGCPPVVGQRVRGELRIEVKDPQGQDAAASAQLVSESNQLNRQFAIGPEGKYVATELPFGVYRLTVTAEGFAEWTALFEVRSEVPVRAAVTLGMAPSPPRSKSPTPPRWLTPLKPERFTR